MSVKENLRLARELISDPTHWGKGWETAKPGCNCAATACNEFSTAAEMFRLLADAIPENSGTSGSASVTKIFAYNDDPKTTHADIIALFDRAIEAAE